MMKQKEASPLTSYPTATPVSSMNVDVTLSIPRGTGSRLIPPLLLPSLGEAGIGSFNSVLHLRELGLCHVMICFWSHQAAQQMSGKVFPLSLHYSLLSRDPAYISQAYCVLKTGI